MKMHVLLSFLYINYGNLSKVTSNIKGVLSLLIISVILAISMFGQAVIL